MNLNSLENIDENKNTYKCHFCAKCDGKGCTGEMPGMGGPKESINFLNNCADWEKIPFGPFKIAENFNVQELHKKIALAPITGATENIGWQNEKEYYFKMTQACETAGIEISLGDGTPDTKLLWGIEAVKSLQKTNPKKKVAVFIKPYPQEKFFERIEWALPVAKIIGVDIDSYNIVTMRNLVHLEKKDASQLLEIKNHLAAKKIPFAIKGVFTNEDLELVKKVCPDIIYISNHGGRVETEQGSTARFLEKNASELKNYCKELWIDGGIRNIQDVKKALSYGTNKILLGRPFISALCLKKDFEILLSEFLNGAQA